MDTMELGTIIRVDKKSATTSVSEKPKPGSSSSSTSVPHGEVVSYGERELFPKPTTDTLDPLNFARWQKWTCLAIVMAMYFLFTFITTTTVPSFNLLMAQYEVTFAQVTWTVAVPALGLSVGPLMWSPLADKYGRRVVFIVGTFIAFVSTIWSAVATTFASYMAARFFQGLGVAPASTVGMAIINDLFFEHERGQKVGLWVLAIDMGLLVGPLVGGFVVLRDQYWVAWICAIMFGVLLLAEVAFLPETLYPRNRMLSCMAASTAAKTFESSEAYVDIPRTKKLGFLNFRPVPGISPPSLLDALVQTWKLFSYPNVSIMVFFYSFAWYWWILSVITYLPVAYIDSKIEVQGLLFGGLIVGTLVSEILFSGTLSDIIMNRFAKKNHGIRSPEQRLWLFWPAISLTTTGLIVWGVSVEKQWHFMIGQFALALFGAGVQMGNTICSAYIIDNYPMHAMSVITFYAVLLNLSAFVNPFLITPWCDTYGFAWTFGVQGAIVFAVMTSVTVCLQMFGEKMRNARGVPTWISPEYST